MIEPTPQPAPRTRKEPHARNDREVADRPAVRSTAVVVGAGVAGLLAAGVLTEFYDRVVIVDRDADRGLPRHGGQVATPPVTSAQPMPALGAGILEELMPGVNAELVRRGARLGDVGRCVVTCVGAHRLASCDTGMLSVSGGPGLLETVLRERIVEAGVQIEAPLFALDLVCADGAAAGVRVTGGDDLGDHDIRAHLVVDASGRASRAPVWLERAGWRAPPELVQPLDLRAVTRRYRLERDKDPGWSAVVQIDRGRTGVAAHDHDDEWTVSLFTGVRTSPAPDPAGFATVAAGMRRPELAGLLADMKPLPEAVSVRASSNLWRRYDRLDRMPPGLVVVGPALACLDPSLGLGTYVALMHAARLRECLRECASGGRPMTGIGDRFFSLAAADLAVPWALATPRCAPCLRDLGDLGDLSDLSALSVMAMIPRHVLRILADAHLDAVCAAGSEDPEVARAVLGVRHRLAPSTSLVSRRILAGSLRDLPGRVRRLG